MSDDPADIACWQRLSAEITTSGRLVEHDVARLAGIGVRHVINLALAGSPGALSNEDRVMARAGLAYTHIPVPFDAPTDAHFASFVAALEAAPRPAHVHCIMNWRVSAFFYRYNREQLDMAEAEARALMQQQWDPDTIEHQDAPAWAAFIARTSKP